MTIIEYGDFITGKKKFSAPAKKSQRCNSVVACTAEVYLSNFPNLEVDIKDINTPSMFYRMFPEIRKYKIEHNPLAENEFRLEDGRIITNLPEDEIRSNFYEEVFYYMRVRTPNKFISCKHLFHLEMFNQMFDGDFTWLPRLFPEDMIQELCSEGYFPEDATLQQFISSYFDFDYKPLTEYERCVPAANGTWRVYEPSTDAVVSISDTLKQRLSYDNMCNISFDGTYVVLDGKPLHTMMEGCVGVYLSGNSYNLVALI